MAGQGLLKFPDGSSYDGHFERGVRHGEGSFVAADGSTYRGQWVDGKQDGTGQLTNPSGNQCVSGTWHEGKQVS